MLPASIAQNVDRGLRGCPRMFCSDLRQSFVVNNDRTWSGISLLTSCPVIYSWQAAKLTVHLWFQWGQLCHRLRSQKSHRS